MSTIIKHKQFPKYKTWTMDLCGRPLTIDNVVHGSLLGGAVLAMELLGVIGDVREDGLAALIEELWFDGPKAEPSDRSFGSAWETMER